MDILTTLSWTLPCGGTLYLFWEIKLLLLWTYYAENQPTQHIRHDAIPLYTEY